MRLVEAVLIVAILCHFEAIPCQIWDQVLMCDEDIDYRAVAFKFLRFHADCVCSVRKNRTRKGSIRALKRDWVNSHSLYVGRPTSFSAWDLLRDRSHIDWRKFVNNTTTTWAIGLVDCENLSIILDTSRFCSIPCSVDKWFVVWRTTCTVVLYYDINIRSRCPVFK